MNNCIRCNYIKKFKIDFFIKFFNTILSINKFINFNKKKNINYLDNKILIEYYPSHESILAQMNVAKILQEKFNAELQLYKSNNYWTIFHRIIFFFLKFVPFSKRKIYHSFGIKKFLFPRISNRKLKKEILKKITCKINNKKDILNIKINNVLVGDLIYDSYLRYFYTETIKVDQKFFKFLENFIMIYLYWDNYLKKNNVRAVVCSHQIYEEGILNRICLKRNIECYQVSLNFVFKSDKKNPNFLYSWFNYKKVFNKFSYQNQKKFLSLAKLFLKKNIKLTKKNKKNREIKILIAIHCIYDAPHAFGKFNFVDMEEWLDTLITFANKSKFKWYLKIHPNCYDKDINIISNLIKRTSKIKILSKECSHSKIINMGITHVLSVYGTIGYEFAYRNIPVILASSSNPYKAYNFLIKSKNKNQYFRILKNIDKKKIKINKKELYQYVYMRFLHNFNILSNYKKHQETKLYKLNDAYCYQYYLKNINSSNQKKILYDLKNKILSNFSGNFYN